MIRACHVALVVKKLPANADVGSIPGLGRSPGGGQEPTPVFLPGESHGKRSLVGYSPWGHKESDMTEQQTRFCPLTFIEVKYIINTLFQPLSVYSGVSYSHSAVQPSQLVSLDQQNSAP